MTSRFDLYCFHHQFHWLPIIVLDNGLPFSALNLVISGLRSPVLGAAFAMALVACGGGGDSATTSAIPLAASPVAAAAAADVTSVPDASQAMVQASSSSSETPTQFKELAAATDTLVRTMALAPAIAPELKTSSNTARIFYVDSRTGSDSNDGSAATKGTGVVGPWLTLGKVASVALNAGDTVLLNCGSVWNETLRLTGAGSASTRITVRSSPAQCPAGTAKPTIDGFARVTNGQWVRQAANQYKIQLPLQQLDNPKFDQGIGRWKMYSDSGASSLSVQTNCGPDASACMRLVSGPNTAGRVLAYSSTFPIAAAASYRIRFDVKAPAGVLVRAFVRRDKTPFDLVGALVSHTGTGGWQSLSMDFKGLAQLDNARVDFDVPGGAHTLMVDNIYVERIIGTPSAASLGTEPLVIAHHPNRGHVGTEPTSPYLRLTADGDNIATAAGQRGSTYLPHGFLALPAGVTLRAGTRVRIRTNAWLIDDRQVASASSGKLYLNAATSYPMKAGWGFYFSGEPWMLDEAGEWLYDAATSTVLVQTATDLAPTSTLSLSVLDTCIDLSGKQYVAIEGLDVKGCRTGVKATSTMSVALRGLHISDSGVNGVVAGASRNLEVMNSRIERSGEHALLGREGTQGMAIGMIFTGNTVIDTAATRVNGKVISLPVQSSGAVIPGEQVTVSDNVVSGSGYHGIRTFGVALIQRNQVDNACLMLDDCGGIYVYAEAQGTQILDNQVRDIPSGLDGKPAGSTSQGQGIFLDDHAHGVTVAGNTVSGAETGIFLHNAYNNTVSGNVLYANRKHQVWLMEDSNIVNPAGDVRNNTITSNLMFSTNGSASVGQHSFVQQTAQFAAFDRNRYSALIANRVVSEAWPTGSNSFLFADWQRAQMADGTPRNQDTAGSVVNPIGYASIRVIGPTIISNGTMSAGAQGWTPWNDTAPLATAVAVSCGGVPCLEVTGGATNSLVATPPFSVIGASWYRVSFDLRSNVANMPVSVQVRRGGGGTNGYESLMGTAEMVNTATLTKRVSFLFKATKSINAADPITRDIGARLYFDRLLPGTKTYLSNVEIVPVTAADAALQTHLLTNTTNVAASVACPDANTTTAARCSQYIDFATGAAVTWPVQLSAGRSTIVYSRDMTLVDTDNDGVSDVQDACAGTTAGSSTNAKGCALGQ